MNPRALTPFFRSVERWFPPAVPPGIELEAALASGSHAGEMWFLATATALLTATAVVPATAGLGSAWLRVPVAGVLLFMVPHFIMGLIALVSPWFAGPRLKREAAQDWCCLAFMTGYAAWKAAGPASGWIAAVCQGWLGFVALNAVFWLVGKLRRGPA